MRFSKVFKDEQVFLDGNEYEDCHFENCELLYAGSLPFVIRGATTLSGVRFTAAGAANLTLNFIRLILACPNGREMLQEMLGESLSMTRIKPGSSA